MSQTPTICRMVQYRLNSQEAEEITNRRRATGTPGNPVEEGTVVPAVVTAVFDITPEPPLVNLHLLLDGPDDYWATSRHEGDEPGEWAWPARV